MNCLLSSQPSGIPSLSVIQYSCSIPNHGSSFIISGLDMNSANGYLVLIPDNIRADSFKIGLKNMSSTVLPPKVTVTSCLVYKDTRDL